MGQMVAKKRDAKTINRKYELQMVLGNGGGWFVVPCFKRIFGRIMDCYFSKT